MRNAYVPEAEYPVGRDPYHGGGHGDGGNHGQNHHYPLAGRPQPTAN
jgi:hypothetical protein